MVVRFNLSNWEINTTLVFPNTTLVFPNTTLVFPNTTLLFPNTTLVFPNTTLFFPNTTLFFPNTTLPFPNTTQPFPNTTLSFPNTTLFFPNTTLLFPNTTILFPNTILPFPNTTLPSLPIFHMFRNIIQITQNILNQLQVAIKPEKNILMKMQSIEMRDWLYHLLWLLVAAAVVISTMLASTSLYDHPGQFQIHLSHLLHL